MKMKRFPLILVSLILCLIPNCMVNACSKLRDKSGVISFAVNAHYKETKCWDIEVPNNTYIRMNLKQYNKYPNKGCSETYMNITTIRTNEMQKFCFSDYEKSASVTALGDVIVYFYHHGFSSDRYYQSSFNMSYHIEDLICTEENHFRCSSHQCIPLAKVCDGVEDCESGEDEIGCILTVKGVNETRESVIKWLTSQRAASFGWGKNTHRAIMSLYLARAFSFLGHNSEEELMIKQLELETTLALLKNSTDVLSVSELSMFVNALSVTCHNPEQFYGLDLLKILEERAPIQESLSPRAYLTICTSNRTLSHLDIQRLLKLLPADSDYPFLLDIQAVAVMALTCAKNKMKEFSGISNASKVYKATIDRFIEGQLSDGSFGNVYTTALVTQALIASKQEVNKRWNVTSTMQYLTKHLNSSTDFLSASLALPIFSGRSLVDIEAINCTNSSRKGEESEISDLLNKIGKKRFIQYSLYIGDQRDIVHTVFLKIPVNSSAYDVMRIAQVIDPKYKFLHRDVSGHMYVYEIAGITNDPEAGQFWLLYTGDNHTNGTVQHHKESPDQFFLGDLESLIMWYKTAHI